MTAPLLAPSKQPPEWLTDLIWRFNQLYTGALNDILDELGHRHQVLPHEIKALRPGMRLAGQAMPIWGEPSDVTDNDALLVPWLKMLQDVTAGCVIVCQPNDYRNAHFGELSSHAAKIHGCQGAVIDGGCRDVDYILHQSKLPVFCRYTTPKDIKGRWMIRAHNVPIVIGETQIEPGDFVVGDSDGVLVVPQRLVLEVLEKAETVARTENQTRMMILQGVPPLEAYERYRRF